MVNARAFAPMFPLAASPGDQREAVHYEGEQGGGWSDTNEHQEIHVEILTGCGEQTISNIERRTSKGGRVCVIFSSSFLKNGKDENDDEDEDEDEDDDESWEYSTSIRLRP